MVEYIEREKLIKDLKNNADYKSECGFKQDIDIESLINYLKKLPSANVVKVIRCENCKHLTIHNSPTLYAYCEKTHYSFEPFKTDTRTHFCSYGELKEREG